MKIRKTVEEFAIITVGTIIVAIAVFFFMLPSHVTVGSGTGLAMVISNFIPLPVSTITSWTKMSIKSSWTMSERLIPRLL